MTLTLPSRVAFSHLLRRTTLSRPRSTVYCPTWCSPLQQAVLSEISVLNNNNNRPRYFSTSSKEDDVVMVSIEEAQSTTAKALERIGWDANDAAIQAEIMTASEVCGNNQGLVKMYDPFQMVPAQNAGKPKLERVTQNSAVVNAMQAPGMLGAVTAADQAVKLLQDNPQQAISIVTCYNTSTSSGQLAFYVDRMARKGYVGLAAANSPELVSASPGAQPVFGTNPLAVGIPTKQGDEPFTFDMATSAVALFGVLSAKAKGQPLPTGVAYDATGQFTTDAAAVLDGGSIATFGGHKGLGLALCVELLAGALSGSAVLGQVPSKKEAKNWGHVFIGIQPNLLVDDYNSKVSSILETVRASAGDGNQIRIPGQRSTETAQERRSKGVVPVPSKIWESILRTAQHGLPEKR
ncbi:malate dehydrogenase [Nitzschia inconspicua]|uniref:Malate dehydrogenase n=1 Tax=Nitzschia inconspicua TaxID=303405 RepID=A0A9K3KAP2_9STRA|nr:malate dehydrogenase [Nitzschia inconspicua]